jgi:hypothetical protein
MKIHDFIKAIRKIFGEINWQKNVWGKDKKNVEPIVNRLTVIQKHLDAAKEAEAKGDNVTALEEVRMISAIGFMLMMRKDAPSRK